MQERCWDGHAGARTAQQAGVAGGGRARGRFPKRMGSPRLCSRPHRLTCTSVPGLLVLHATVIAMLSACGGAQAGHDAHPGADLRIGAAAPALERAAEVESVHVAAALPRMPSGVAVADDRMFVAIPRWDGGDSTLHELRDGVLHPWPSMEENDPSGGIERLHSVNGMRLDDRGRLWVLDNARIGFAPPAVGAPKIVVYDIASGRRVFTHHFAPAVAPATSFMNDIALDLDRGFAYITETGMGGPPALVVFEVAADRAWRAIEGHPGLSADPALEMRIDGERATVQRDGVAVPWRVGANPIALAADGETLLFGAMTNTRLWQIPTEALRDTDLADEARTAAASPAFEKPMTDGMDVLHDGRPVLTDVENAALAVVGPDGVVSSLVRSPAFSFPVAIHVVDERTLYFTSNQLHLMPLLHGGEDRSTPPYFVWRVTLAPTP